MPSTMTKAERSIEVNSLDGVRTQMLKVSPALSSAVQASPLSWSEVLKDGLIEACGKLHAAAVTMGIDPSQLSRDLQSGSFQIKRLEKLSVEERSIVVKRLNAAFLELADPHTYALSLIDSNERALKELRQYVEERRIA